MTFYGDLLNKSNILNSKKYKLKNNMCVISDRSGPLGLGGIIGGTRSGTEFKTKK
mgnify:CR=1 FL=1